nr:hypothetical protein [Pseudomonas sp. ALS1131]
MLRIITPLLLALFCFAARAGELDGHYRAVLDGQPSELILRQNGTAVEGEYVEGKQLRLAIKGQYDGKLLRAEISDPQSGLLLANMNANYANAMLNASIAARNPKTAKYWSVRHCSSARRQWRSRPRQELRTRSWSAPGCTKRSSTVTAPTSPRSTH